MGAIGSLAATGLASRLPAIISHIAKKRMKNNAEPLFNGNKQTVQQDDLSENLEPKYKEILQNIVKSKNNNGSTNNRNGSNGSSNMSNPLTNIIGSGIKSF